MNAKYFAQYNLDAVFRDKDPQLLVFSHFASGVGEKVYNKFTGLDKLKQVLEENLNEYNEENPQVCDIGENERTQCINIVYVYDMPFVIICIIVLSRHQRDK